MLVNDSATGDSIASDDANDGWILSQPCFRCFRFSSFSAAGFSQSKRNTTSLNNEVRIMKISKNMMMLSGAVVAAGGILTWWQWNAASDPAANPETRAAEVVTEPQAAEALTNIQLPPEKLMAAGVSLTQASTISMELRSQVPGRLQYDDRRHVEIRSAAAGIITEIHVKPGDFVQTGDIVLELNSPEVGSARADVLLRKSELKLATENRDWQESTCQGLQKLADAIRSRISVQQIRAEFRDVVLGKSRDQLLSAYSDLLLSESLASAAEESTKNGIVPGKLLEQRINARDNMESTLLSALEEQTFAAKQSCRQAQSQFEDAEHRFRISLQTVATLLGKTPKELNGALTANTVESDLGLQQQESLSVVQLRAPFPGTIERRMFSTNERVSAGDSLLTLADTTTLWVAADLREREWNALTLKSGDIIHVLTSIPGLDARPAEVYFVGREVDPATNAVPLIATVDNSDGKLRPGMFVRVAVPVADARQTLAVPESSVLEHDRQAFVFIPSGHDSFRRVDIKPGIQTAGMVEVLSGLADGDKVVTTGGFFLKSELLLKGEAE